MSHQAFSELLSDREPDADKICVVTAFAGDCAYNMNLSPLFIKQFQSVSLSQSSTFQISGDFEHVHEALMHRELPAKAGEGIDSAYWCVANLMDEPGTAFIKAIKKKIAALVWGVVFQGLLGGYDVAGTVAGHLGAGPAAVIASDTLGNGNLGPVGNAIALILTNPTKYNIDALAKKILGIEKAKRINAYFTRWTKKHAVQKCILIRVEPCSIGRCFFLGKGEGALRVTTKVLANLIALLVAAPDGQHYSDDMIDAETLATIQAASLLSLSRVNSSYSDRALEGASHA